MSILKQDTDTHQRRGKKNVWFATKLKYHEIMSHRDYSEKELRKCWYEPDEEERMNDKSNEAIERYESGKPLRRNETYRGLEPWTEDGERRFARSVEKCVDGVMDEQNSQWDMDINDWDRLAEVSLSVTDESKRRSRRIAVQDEKDAMHIYGSLVKTWPTTQQQRRPSISSASGTGSGSGSTASSGQESPKPRRRASVGHDRAHHHKESPRGAKKAGLEGEPASPVPNRHRAFKERGTPRESPKRQKRSMAAELLSKTPSPPLVAPERSAAKESTKEKQKSLDKAPISPMRRASTDSIKVRPDVKTEARRASPPPTVTQERNPPREAAKVKKTPVVERPRAPPTLPKAASERIVTREMARERRHSAVETTTTTTMLPPRMGTEKRPGRVKPRRSSMGDVPTSTPVTPAATKVSHEQRAANRPGKQRRRRSSKKEQKQLLLHNAKSKRTVMVMLKHFMDFSIEYPLLLVKKASTNQNRTELQRLAA